MRASCRRNWARRVREALRAGVAAACLAAAGAAAAAPARGASQADGGAVTIAIQAMAYVPATQRAKPGSLIVWINNDLVPHTVTASDGSFRSPAIAPGASWSVVAPKKGTFAYQCDFHPAMAATLVVN